MNTTAATTATATTMNNTPTPTPAPTGNYTVRIKYIDCDHFPRWVALDESNDWRAKGYHTDMHNLNGRELVQYLYHADEVLRAWVDEDGVTWAEIATWGPQAGE